MDERNNGQWKRVENKLLGDNATVELVNGNHMTLCRYKITTKTTVPLHSHEYEQIIYVLEGEMILTVEGEQIYMQAGDIYVIRSNLKHCAEITGIPYQSIESYYPIRIDLLAKNID